MPRRLIAMGVAAAALGAAAYGGVALASGNGDGGDASGPAAEQAKAAAIAAVPGGPANAVERDSEDGATWEVEVAKPDGSVVDVRLDASYGVVVIEGDTESNETADDETADADSLEEEDGADDASEAEEGEEGP